MAVIAVVCPHCNSDHVIKRGKTAGGKQRYRCLNPDCSQSSFVLNPAYAAGLPEVKQKIVDMALHGSGVPDHLGDSLTDNLIVYLVSLEDPHIRIGHSPATMTHIRHLCIKLFERETSSNEPRQKVS